LPAQARYVESYQLDIQDRITAVTNIENQVMDIAYGLGDMVRSMGRFDGSTITNTYDYAGRKASMVYNPGEVGEVEIGYTYYPDGQLKTITDDITVISNVYDNLNRPVNSFVTLGAAQVDVERGFDPAGNLTNVVMELVGAPWDLELSYGFDAAERLASVAGAQDAGVFEYVYNPTNGRVASVSNTVSGITASYAYDLLDRATNITYSASDGSLIHSLEYAYDAAGMITNKTIKGGTTSVSSYAYDSIYRLVGETHTGGTTASLSYAYDLAGNRSATVINGTTNVYTLGTGNRLSFWGVNGSALYDAAGNTTNLVFNNGTQLDLNWDSRYRLDSVETPNGTVDYAYCVYGYRVGRTFNGQTENYLLSDGHVVADMDGSGNLLRTYTYGSGVDNILSMTSYGSTETNTYYYLKDHQNTVIALIDETGTVVESYEYDAYGRVLDVKDGTGSSIANQKSAIGNRYTFQGREIDWETGLIYFRARWYNPETGRWLSKDPIGISGGLNQYAFCGNNPVNFCDPSGLAPGDNYSTQDEAAIAASQEICGQSTEYGGWIYETEDGYSYTEAVTDGNETQISYRTLNQAEPEGSTAWYHNHPSGSGSGGERFSGIHGEKLRGGDKGYSALKNKNAYVATPSGKVKLYQPGLKDDNEKTVGCVKE
jgi:RHS repeat-associated protein